jgi:hypothetical protein
LKLLTYSKILDPDPEVIFDDLARLAAHICGTPIALINFIEGNRQSFKAKVVDGTEVLPGAGLCLLAIQQSEVVTECKQHRYCSK